MVEETRMKERCDRIERRKNGAQPVDAVARPLDKRESARCKESPSRKTRFVAARGTRERERKKKRNARAREGKREDRCSGEIVRAVCSEALDREPVRASERADPWLHRTARHARRRPLSNPENIVPRRRYRVAGRPAGRLVDHFTSTAAQRALSSSANDHYPRRCHPVTITNLHRRRGARGNVRRRRTYFAGGRQHSRRAVPRRCATNRSSKMHANALVNEAVVAVSRTTMMTGPRREQIWELGAYETCSFIG